MEQYVKDKQMLHKDVNTGNVLFDKSLGDVELVDWGIWVHQEVRAKPVLHF
jgi:Ser/Thr protein kinase RdoA (MazF antagonist)